MSNIPQGISPSDLPAWLQAGAAIVALALSTWGIVSSGRSQKRRDALQAKTIAAAVYLELEKLRVTIASHRQGLRSFEERSGHMVGQFVAAQIQQFGLATPTMLDRNLDRLYLLGEPAGPACLQLMSVIEQYNDFVEQIAARTVMLDAGKWHEGIDQLDQHLVLIDGIAEKCASEIRPLHDAIRK